MTSRQGDDREPVVAAYCLSHLLAVGIKSRALVCRPCGKARTYALAPLMERHGDIRLTDLVSRASARCPHRRETEGRCAIRYEALLTRRAGGRDQGSPQGSSGVAITVVLSGNSR